MKYTLLLGFLVLGSFSLAQAAPACPTATMNQTLFERIKKDNYNVPSGMQASEISAVLVECLSSPNSELRDTYGYGILARWIRRGTLTPEQMRGMVQQLLPNLKANLGDQGKETAFRRTFGAMMLSELLGQDNRTPYLTPAEFGAILEAGLAYLPAERDLRGFDPKYGYVHGVAHGADILYRAAQSPRLSKADIPRILKAIGSKIAPAGETAYSHGEDERLVRPLAALIHRDLLGKDELKTYLGEVLKPAPFSSWDDIWFDSAGLVKRHNIKLFLLGSVKLILL